MRRSYLEHIVFNRTTGDCSVETLVGKAPRIFSGATFTTGGLGRWITVWRLAARIDWRRKLSRWCVTKLRREFGCLCEWSLSLYLHSCLRIHIDVVWDGLLDDRTWENLGCLWRSDRTSDSIRESLLAYDFCVFSEITWIMIGFCACVTCRCDTGWGPPEGICIWPWVYIKMGAST